MMVDITKKYRTREGHEVVLFSDKGYGEHSILGATQSDEGKLFPLCWTPEGKHKWPYAVPERDLVPVPQVVDQGVWWIVMWETPPQITWTQVRLFSTKEKAEKEYNKYSGYLGVVPVHLKIEV